MYLKQKQKHQYFNINLGAKNKQVDMCDMWMLAVYISRKIFFE